MYPYPRSPFSRFAKWTAHATGHPLAFVLAAATIVVWAITGPVFGFSDTWQLVINTGTTVVTFLMVFLIQNTQNRDAKATQLKLDELIRAISKARNRYIGAESDPDDRLKSELKELEAEPEPTRKDDRAHAVVDEHREPEPREPEPEREREQHRERQPHHEPVHDRRRHREARVARPAERAAHREVHGLRRLREADDDERADPRRHHRLIVREQTEKEVREERE